MILKGKLRISLTLIAPAANPLAALIPFIRSLVVGIHSFKDRQQTLNAGISPKVEFLAIFQR